MVICKKRPPGTSCILVSKGEFDIRRILSKVLRTERTFLFAANAESKDDHLPSMPAPDDHLGRTRQDDPNDESRKIAFGMLTEIFDTYVWEMETSSDFVEFPPKFSELFQAEKGLDYSSFLSRILPEDLPKWENLIATAKSGRSTKSEEIRFGGNDSKILAFLTAVRKDPRAEKNRLLFFLQDISEQKSAQEKQSLDTERLKFATRAANVGIWDLDIGANILVWDEAMYRLYGIKAEEFSGAYEAWVKGLHPEDKDRATEEFRLTMAGVRDFNTEFRVVWPNGTIRYIKAIAAALRKSDGTVTRIIGTNWDISEIRFAEEENKKNQEAISKINEVAKIGSWEIDLRTNTVSWSKKTKEIHELPEDHPASREDFLRFIKEDDSKKKISEAQSNAIELGIGYDIDLQIITEQGNSKWVRTLGQAEFKDGKCLRLFGIYQDIEERRRIEDNLLVSESTFRGAFEHSGIGIALVSTEGRWLKVNGKICEMLGYPEEELLVTTFQDITHPDDLETDMNYVGQMLRGELASYSMEKRYFRKDGSIIWINLSVSMVRDKNKRPLYFVSQIEDITQKKIAEQSLLAVHDEMKLILDSATQVAIIRTNASGIISHFSKGAENLLGYASSEVVGKHTPEFFHVPEEMEKRSVELRQESGKPIAGFEALIAIAKRDRFESKLWQYKRKDGTIFPAQLVVTSILNVQSEIVGYLGVVTDLTETVVYQKKLEETKRQLEILTEQLERRNAQLLNYAHITSHNLRAPASNLISLLELIQESESPEETESLIHKFKISVDYLRETLDSLVEVLRIQEFAKREIETVRFQESLEKIKKILEGQIIETETEIEFDFGAFGECEYNKSYLESILLNLVSNSIKYRSPDRRLKITVYTENSNGKRYLNVKDNGLGIDLKKNEGKLFGLHKTFHRHPEARGVGLFLTKTQVESLGGRIFAQSEPNKGTTITIEFSPDSVPVV